MWLPPPRLRCTAPQQCAKSPAMRRRSQHTKTPPELAHKNAAGVSTQKRRRSQHTKTSPELAHKNAAGVSTQKRRRSQHTKTPPELAHKNAAGVSTQKRRWRMQCAVRTYFASEKRGECTTVLDPSGERSKARDYPQCAAGVTAV